MHSLWSVNSSQKNLTHSKSFVPPAPDFGFYLHKEFRDRQMWFYLHKESRAVETGIFYGGDVTKNRDFLEVKMVSHGQFVRNLDTGRC